VVQAGSDRDVLLRSTSVTGSSRLIIAIFKTSCLKSSMFLPYVLLKIGIGDTECVVAFVEVVILPCV
jgi:hypothetical protein